MRVALMIGAAILAVSGCSSKDVMHYTTYDLDRDGVMDARCPGMTYDPSNNTLYSWRNKASKECAEQAASGG